MASKTLVMFCDSYSNLACLVSSSGGHPFSKVRVDIPAGLEVVVVACVMLVGISVVILVPGHSRRALEDPLEPQLYPSCAS